MMVSGWLEDVIKSNNPFADTLIQNVHRQNKNRKKINLLFRRWLCLESSKLYDPFLNKILAKLMKMVFGYLLNKLKSLGASIIFANTNKLIISTGKDNFAAAENYTNFILTTVVSYPLFTYLNLNISRYWKILLFKDNFNYAGIIENEVII
jgi:DNA polymerase epsilon subunit 1